MELIEAIKSRKSIRGYKPTPVPKEILSQVVEIATRAPSALNTQPWKFTILGGTVLDQLKEALQRCFLEGSEMHPDFPLSPSIEGVYRERQVTLGKSLYQLLGITKEDKGKQIEWMAKSFRFFDAPNAIIISMDEKISGFSSMFSLGAVAQTICLAALDFGLGTCIEQSPVLYPEVVRQIAVIPPSEKIAVAIAIGYPDWDFSANRLVTERESLSKVASWRGL
jgi:nitroreductase